MVTLGLTMFCLFPTTEMAPLFSVLPVVGPGLLLKGLLKANGPSTEMYLYAIPVLVTSIGYSLLALWWAIEQFSREEVLFREAEVFDLRLWIRHLLRDKEPIPTFAEAVFCLLVILLLQFFSWSSLQSAIQNTPEADRGAFQIKLLIVQQITTIAMPALIMGLILTTSVRRTFSLRWPGFRRIACAALLPFTLHPLTTELLKSLQWFFPTLQETSKIAEFASELQRANLWLVILALCVAPAFCEEIAFRGFLLAGFRRGGRIRLAIVLSSCAFGIIHMIPQQVFNATLLGLILGSICVRNRSLLPCIVFHFIHNLLTILLDRYGKEVPTDQVWSFLFRKQEDVLRYQPALLCLLSVLCIGLLHRLLKPAAIPDLPDPVRQSLNDLEGQSSDYRSTPAHG
jgi:sodium transport system permease protein